MSKLELREKHTKERITVHGDKDDKVVTIEIGGTGITLSTADSLLLANFIITRVEGDSHDEGE